MADAPTNADLHDQQNQDMLQLQRRNALRHALSILDPQPGDVALDYAGLVTRLQAVLAREAAPASASAS
jgi:hypothetical protein